MRSWLRGPRGGLCLFLLIAGLVGGGLGWMTAAVLRLEREQQQAHADAELANSLRLALWRLDSRFVPELSREEGRAYNHYSFLSRHPRTLVQGRNNRLVPDATVLQLSPLLTTELPEWMLLHFQVDEFGWSSPQDPPKDLVEKLQKKSPLGELRNRTTPRARLLAELGQHLPAKELLARIDQRGTRTIVPDRTVLLAQVNPVPSMQSQLAEPPNQQPQGNQQFGQFLDPGARSRIIERGKVNPEAQNSAVENIDNVLNDLRDQGANWFNDNNKKSLNGEVSLKLTPMVPAWVTTTTDREHLLLVREVRVEGNQAGRICQGVVLDTQRLQNWLLEEVQVREVFPNARLEPIRSADAADPLKRMATLPFQLEPGTIEVALEEESWTPLRLGLALAWSAAGVGLLAVGFVGWSLIDLSERRFRFVSAVTHELRTPLTTLRLYLDMLLNGLVRDEKQKQEYLTTLHGESDRLSRLVNNVLDYSRLEKQRPKLERQPIAVGDLIEQVRTTWQGRCQDSGKKLVVESTLPAEVGLVTDGELVQQILANLIDNSCKYSRDANDPHIWLRANAEPGRIVLEVEDRGPGVPPRERRAIFRAFRRGRANEATGGGVGLGLALADRWARLLGGRLSLSRIEGGACFRLELPHAA